MRWWKRWYGRAGLVALLVQPVGLAAQATGVGGGPADEGYETRTSPGEVTMEVRPAWGEGALAFAIVANTHSVDLSGIELADATRLIVADDTLAPDATGALRGHHARAAVRFRLPSRPERFSLEIRGVPDVPVRRLSWPGADTVASSAGPGRVVAVGGIGPGGLALLDAASLRVLRTVDGLEAVHGSAVDADGTRAYALNMADSARAVTVIDVATGEMERTVGLPGPGHHAAAGPQGGIVYVAYGRMALDPGTPRGIAAVDPATGRARTVSTGGTPFYLATDPEGGRLYAAVQGPESGAGRLLILELPSLEIERARELSGTPSHMVLSADGGSLFVALMEGRVLRLDVPGLTVRAEGEAGPDAHAVAVDGSSGRAFVANRGAGTLTVLDAGTLGRIDEVDVARLPTHLLALPDGRLLVSDGASKTLLALDPRTLEVLDRIKLPFQPHQSSVSGR
jgi:YVTN family beta-propeller protein